VPPLAQTDDQRYRLSRAVAENQPDITNQNRMASSLSEFARRLQKFMMQADRSSAGSTEHHQRIFDELAVALFALQFAHNEDYRKFCEFRGVTPHKIAHWSEIPAIPTSAFTEIDLTSLPLDDRKVVFRSSGTISVSRSRHFHSAESLALYETSLLSWFKPHLIPDLEQPLAMLSLTPEAAVAPDSSLVHMFETIRAAYPLAEGLFAGAVGPDASWSLNFSAIVEFLRSAAERGEPVLLMGTAFNFVHLLDYCIEHHLTPGLPPGSRILETGGYKGRSRVISKRELHDLLTARLGVPSSHIITEYGMSELSSQAYDSAVPGTEIQPGWQAAAATISVSLSPGERAAVRGKSTSENPSDSTSRLFRFPSWARAQIISPETGQSLSQGQTGLIRVFDLANVWSVMAIQTEDLGIRHETGFELIGRANAAQPRGCSLMASDR